MGPIELIAKLVLFASLVLVVISPYLVKKYGKAASSEDQAATSDNEGQATILVKSLLWTAVIGALPTLLFIGQLQQLTAKGDGLFKFGVSVLLLPLLFLFLYFVFAISIAIVSRKYKNR